MAGKSIKKIHRFSSCNVQISFFLSVTEKKEWEQKECFQKIFKLMFYSCQAQKFPL